MHDYFYFEIIVILGSLIILTREVLYILKITDHN